MDKRRLRGAVVLLSLTMISVLLLTLSLGGANDEAHAQAVDDHGDDAGTATTFPIPGSVSGVIASGGDVDAFAVDLVAGNRYVFWANPSSFDATLELSDPAGVVVAANSDCTGAGCPSPTQARIELAATSSGTFTLLLSAPGGDGGAYALFAKDQTPLLFPTPTVDGVRVDGRLAFATDRDEWLVDLVAGTRYLVYGEPAASLDFGLELRDPSGALLASDTDCDAGCRGSHEAALEFVAPVTGTFTLTALRVAGIANDYSLFAKDLTPQPFPTPTVDGVRVDDRLVFRIDRGVYAVDLVAGTRYLVYGEPATSLDLGLELRDPFGALLASDTDCTSGCRGDHEAALEFVAPVTGTFTLVALRSNGIPNAYSLFAKDLTPQALPTPTSDAASVGGRLQFRIDRDVYAVDLVGGVPLLFAALPPGNFDASLRLEDEFANVIAADSDCDLPGCDGTWQAAFEVTPPASGTYLLTVSRSNGIPNNYTLWGKDLTPQPFLAPTPESVQVGGRLRFGLDRDPYLLDLTTGIPTLLFASTPGSFNAGLWLRDGSGATVALNEDCRSVGCAGVNEAAIELASGRNDVLLLTIFRASGTANEYTVFGKDLTPQPFPALAPGRTSEQGRLAFRIDRDVFAAAISAGDTVRVFAQPPGNLDAGVRLFAPGGSLLASDSQCAAPACGSSSGALVDVPVAVGGVHTFEVFRVAGVPNTYTLDVFVEPPTPLGVPDRLAADVSNGLDADTDLYSLQLEGGGDYTFYLRRKSGSTAGRLSLLDAAGVVHGSDERPNEGLITFRPAAGGQYFLRVDGPPQTYQIYTDRDVVVPILVPSDSSGVFELPIVSDVDVFTVELEAGIEYLVVVDDETAAPFAPMATTLSVEDGAGVELARNADCIAAGCLSLGDAQLVIVAPEDGTYTIRVAHEAIADDELARLDAASYLLRVRRHTGDPLTAPSTRDGSLGLPFSLEAAVYPVALLEFGQYEFRLQSPAGALGVLILEDGAGNVIATDVPCDGTGCSPGDRVLRFDALEGGAALLRVTHASPLLTGTFALTTSLTFPGAISIVLDAPGSNRDFAFVAEGLPVLGFALDDPFVEDGDGVGRVASFDPLAPGQTYLVDQLTPFGWELREIRCNGATTSTVTVRATGVTIALEGNDAVTCVFVNVDLDADDDGLTDEQEQLFGTDAFNPDSDGDGVGDGHELLIDDTDPRLGGHVGSCGPAFVPPIAPIGWTFTRYTCEDTTVDELLAALASAGATSVTIAIPSGDTVTGVSTVLPFVNLELRAMFPNGVRGGTLLAVRGLGPRSFR